MKKFILNMLNVDAIMITVIAFIFMFFISEFVPSFSAITPSSQNNNSLSDIFARIDYQNSRKDTAFNIILVDMTDIYSRRDIAELLTKVHSYHPKMIGVDLSFFYHKDSSGTIEDDSILIQAVKDVAKETVFVLELEDYSGESNSFQSAKHSFFADSVTISEGFSNIKNNLDQNTVSFYRASEYLGDKKVYSLTAEMLRKCDMLDINEEEEIPIDFSSTLFITKDASDLTVDDIKDNFVLIGAAKSNDDIVKTPIGAMPGLLLQAYTLNSMLNKTEIVVVSKFVNILFCLIVCYLLSVVLVWSDRVLDEKNTAKSIFFKQSSLLPQICSALWLLIIMLFSYVIYRGFNCYVNVFYAITILAITVETRNLYSGAIAAISTKRRLRLFKNSIYNKRK